MMLQLTEYDVGALRHQGTRTFIYDARRRGDGCAVVIKTPRSPQPPRADVTRLVAEYEIGRSVVHEAVLHHLALEWDGHRPALVLEDFGGSALAGRLAGRRLSLPVVLDLSVQLAEGLEALHARQIIHKDINPANVIYNDDVGRAKIADFGIATVIDRETPTKAPVQHLEGTLPYVSPEQTGRMNRSVDYRTDFYSFGVTLFEMLGGRLPFASMDAVQLVHAHIARKPPALDELDPSIPPTVAAIISKLLAKTPEERYQSAEGLAADLRRCRDALTAGGRIPSFALGASDVSSSFRIPERLYGRQRAVDKLLGSFARATEGSRELLLVSGEAGIGKSCLVQEVQRPVVERHGWFVSGRFDDLQRDTPHSALLESLRQLIQQLLTQSEDEVVAWRERLAGALGDEGQVLVEPIPEIELLLGPQQPVSSLPPVEAEHRFARLVRRLLRSLAGPAHPLVIFLDDLQWANAGSLRLIELLMADDEVHHLLVVGCYVDDDLPPTHPLTSLLTAVEQGPATLTIVRLSRLQPGHIAKLIADTVRSEVERVQSLAELIHGKTLGNPSFVHQFITSLYSDGLLSFDHQHSCWTWDTCRIEGHQVPSNVVSFLIERMKRLPSETLRMLELAACIGGRFDLGTLAIVAEQRLCAVARALRPALEGGVVQPLDSGLGRLLAGGNDQECAPEHGMDVACAFVNDGVRQAAYGRIPTEQRRSVHLQLGRLLYAHLGTDKLHERLFEVVNHFVAGKDGLTDVHERLQVVRLNHRAGLKAMAAAAYRVSQRHFRVAIELLPADRWECHYELTFDLYLQLAECLLGDPTPDPEMLALGQEMLQRAATLTDRKKALAWHIVVLARSGDPEKAINLGLEMLREGGIDLSPPDLDRAVREGYEDLRIRLQGRTIAELAHLPQMTVEEHAATLELIQTTLFPIFMRRRELIPLTEMAAIRMSLEHGNGPLSGVAYAGYARVVAHVFGDFASAYEFARLGRAVADATGVFRAAARGLTASAVDWLKDPAAVALSRLREAFRLGVEIGEPFYPALFGGFVPQLAYAAGVPLDALYEECQTLERYVAEQMADIGVREMHITMRTIDALRGRRPWGTAIFANEQNERDALDVMRIRNPEGAAWYHLQSSRLAYLFGNHSRALEMAERARDYADRTLGFFADYDAVFQRALALAACTGSSTDAASMTALEQMADTLKGWVDAGASANFHHKWLIVSAELARLRSDTQEAGPAYEAAIEAAGQAGFVHDEAVANERAAEFYLSRGIEKVARVYLNDARYAYEKWGAVAKVSHLMRRHPGLTEGTAEHAVVEVDPTRTQALDSTTSAQASWFDFATVIKASRAISSEIVLDDLLRKLLLIVAENAGAERAVLVLKRDGELVVEASNEAGGGQVELYGGVPIQEVDGLSAGVVQYVARTHKAVVLDDASREGTFRADPYISRQRSRSVLCTPLAAQGRLVGVIYLENNLTRGAFSRQRLELVDVLCAQATISIEQARLYAELERTNRELAEHSQTLEQEVARRTRDLAERNDQLHASLTQLREVQNQLLISEKMASLGNLVAGVAHEINTPVGAVVSSADTSRRCLSKLREAVQTATGLQELLQSRLVGRLLDMLDENTQVVATAGERVSEIVRTLRSFARLDEAERKPADLHEGLEGTLTLARHRLKRGIKVVKEYGQLPPVHCYPNQINQVFMNLLTNAIDAIDQRKRLDPLTGGGARGTIRLRTWTADGEAYVQVADDGVGIPREELGRVFDPGYTTKGVGVGTGLGLAICFNIVEKHKGNIEFTSSRGEGSVFTVSVPIR